MESPALSIVLPCYNEEANVERTVREALTWLDAAGIRGEVIGVNDGSADATGSILATLAQSDGRVRVVTHERNQGYGVAIRSGCDAAQGELISFVDSDGQFHIADLQLLLPFMDEYQLVTGRRRHRADPLPRKVFGKILGLLVFLLFGMWLRDVNCGMKVFRRTLWPTIRPVHGVEKLFNTEVFLRMKLAGIPWKTVDVPHYPRRAGNPTGASPWVIIRMFQEMWNLRMKMGKKRGVM
jgi:glycosyltransferase involved in cell wall biosynthesis